MSIITTPTPNMKLLILRKNCVCNTKSATVRYPRFVVDVIVTYDFSSQLVIMSREMSRLALKTVHNRDNNGIIVTLIEIVKCLSRFFPFICDNNFFPALQITFDNNRSICNRQFFSLLLCEFFSRSHTSNEKVRFDNTHTPHTIT